MYLNKSRRLIKTSHVSFDELQISLLQRMMGFSRVVEKPDEAVEEELIFKINTTIIMQPLENETSEKPEDDVGDEIRVEVDQLDKASGKKNECLALESNRSLHGTKKVLKKRDSKTI